MSPHCGVSTAGYPGRQYLFFAGEAIKGRDRYSHKKRVFLLWILYFFPREMIHSHNKSNFFVIEFCHISPQPLWWIKLKFQKIEFIAITFFSLKKGTIWSECLPGLWPLSTLHILMTFGLKRFPSISVLQTFLCAQIQCTH